MWWLIDKCNSGWKDQINERLMRIEEYLQETKDFFAFEDLEKALEKIDRKTAELTKLMREIAEKPQICKKNSLKKKKKIKKDPNDREGVST